jgi:predicted Zn-dependent protease
VATPRIDALRALVAQDPGDATTHYMLAHEYFKVQLYAEAVDAVRRYLALAEDEGAAYRVLAHALERLDRRDEARQAYRDGLAAATRHRHEPMIAEFTEALQGLS